MNLNTAAIGGVDAPAGSSPFDKPYKGADSYQVEDSALFYGRNAESEQVVARILSSRFTLLHAQSGAGKTSLINARIIPGLEQRDWLPVRIRPENDPIAATRNATLRYLIPPPDAEVLAIRRALDLLQLDEHQTTIADLLSRYDELATRDPRKRQIIAPIESDTLEARYPLIGKGALTPYTCRVIRGSLDLARPSEQWRLVLELASTILEAPSTLSDDLLLTQVLSVLESDTYQSAYRTLLGYLDPPGDRSLCNFFDNLIQVYGSRLVRFGIVLIFDQFEEVFTRFVDPGAAGKAAGDLADWRLRWELLDELKQLYAYRTSGLGPPAPLPIRFVVSMRSEYMAGLEPLRASVPALDQCSYHLQMLSVDQASRAIKAPAADFGYGYAQDCYDRIVADLTKEERFVEPAHLQVVCDYLWNEKGRELSGAVDAPDRSISREVKLAVYEESKGLSGIMRAFLWGYLNGLEQGERFETLEMLERLITTSNTRNIVEQESLTNAPLRDDRRRRNLLDQLIVRGIVRTESRLGGRFVEITHEFLIPPVMEAIRDVLLADPAQRQFLHALDALRRIQQQGSGADDTLLSWEFEILDRFRTQIEWPEWAMRAMLRNAVLHEAGGETLRHWVARVDEGDLQKVSTPPAVVESSAESSLRGLDTTSLKDIGAGARDAVDATAGVEHA
ncbi:hypothetical protein FG147_11070 [Thauera sp. UPWRP]|nr:hypothetical protein [Thauera sp.]TMW70779.1 hypothetical protein FG147_11070 [Thauera sp. UPWRP]